MSRPASPEEFGNRAIGANVATRRQIDQALSEVGTGATITDLVEKLQRSGVITTLQAEKLNRGDRDGYFYGDYKVLYLIGAGTFARVYRAEKDGKVHAVKVLRKRFRDQPSELEQFLREGRMGLKLKHPNIVRISDVVPDTRNPFLVMEFVEGQTLRELTQIRGRLDVDLTLSMMEGITGGLAFASSFGISHRDLKLSNVLTTVDGVAKLVDFGLAALADRNNPEEVADCPNARAIDYAALERGTNVRKDDPRSDIYFAGAMMYHMLAGQPPLSETRDRLARLNVSRFSAVRPIQEVVADLPGGVAAVVAKSMEVNPEKRIQSAAAFQAEIRRVIELIKAGPQAAPAGPDMSVDAASVGDDTIASNEGEGYTVMLVESKVALQNAVRDRLKARGYRVLIITDPERALGRFGDADERPADCVIFGAAEMGAEALDAFNRFADGEVTGEVPSILLVDQKQRSIIAGARRGKNRLLLPMPLRVKQLRAALVRLLAETPRRTAGVF